MDTATTDTPVSEAHHTKPFKCLGCEVTYDEIERLRLDVSFPYSLPRDDRSLPLCSRCAKEGGTLARIIAKQIHDGGHLEDSQRRVEVLFNIRDNLIEARSLDAFAARYGAVNEVLNRHHGAIGELRKRLGLDAEKPTNTKLAALGAMVGALLGAGIIMSKRPLETLRQTVARMAELLEQIAPAAASPEDAPLD